MNLLHPLALAWLGLAIPIVIFYILKIRMRRVPVSTTLFWRQIFEEKQPRSIWQKLRHLLSLLVQLAFLLAGRARPGRADLPVGDPRGPAAGPGRRQLGEHERHRRRPEPDPAGEGQGGRRWP